jgi:hypothetical protein
MYKLSHHRLYIQDEIKDYLPGFQEHNTPPPPSSPNLEPERTITPPTQIVHQDRLEEALEQLEAVHGPYQPPGELQVYGNPNAPPLPEREVNRLSPAHIPPKIKGQLYKIIRNINY